jgi:hypothetical protein
MYIYVSTVESSFRKGGKVITYKRGGKIEPQHEFFMLEHYSGRIKRVDDGIGVVGFEQDTIKYERKEKRLQLEPSIITEPKPIETDIIIEKEKVEPEKKVVKEKNKEDSPKPTITPIILDSVIQTKGIEKMGEPVDERKEGESISEERLEAARKIKKRKNKKG